MSTNEPSETEQAVSANAPSSTTSTSTESWTLRLIRDPLSHFLLLGAALFVAYGYLQNDEPPETQQFVVSAGKIEHLAALFTRTWQRPPTPEELRGLIDDYVREEVAYREGVAIGLDVNDTIIRRRIRQKLDFVAQDLAGQVEPTDEQLQSYLEKNPTQFRNDPRLSFRQVFFDPEQHGEDLQEMVSDLVASLREDSSIDAKELGDRTLLEHGYQNVSKREIANLLGQEFAAAIVEVEPGEWHGPLGSAYGAHAIIVDEFQPSERPELEQVRAAVRREWEHQRHQELKEEFYQGLIDKYEIKIDWPEAATEVSE